MTKNFKQNILESHLYRGLNGEDTGLSLSYMSGLLWHGYEEDILDTLISNRGSILDEDKILTDGKYWEISWYPDTPIGSYRVISSTLDMALRYMNQDWNSIGWEERLLQMFGDNLVAFELEFNEPRLVYDTASNLHSRFNWISPEDRQIACRENHVWTIQARLKNEIDLRQYAAATLENLISFCEQHK